MDQIGITDNKLHHMLGVARKAYQLAIERGHDKIFARRMFLLGYIHDVGYEFSYTTPEHPIISANMLYHLADIDINDKQGILKNSYNAIRLHGQYTDEETEEWRILTMADFLVDNTGNEVTVTQRLEDIKERYGEYSDQYLTSCDVCYRIGLTPQNVAGNII